MADVTSKKQRRLDTDKDILDAALIVFGRYGYGNAKLAEIAKLAHISSGLIVQNFGSKQELLVSLIKREALRLFALFTVDCEDWQSAISKIYDYMIQLFSDEENNGRACLQFFSTLLNNSSSPISAFSGMKQHVTNSPVIPALREGQKAGEVKDGDCVRLLGLFYRTMTTVLAHCYKYNLEPPKKEWFISVLRK